MDIRHPGWGPEAGGSDVASALLTACGLALAVAVVVMLVFLLVNTYRLRREVRALTIAQAAEPTGAQPVIKEDDTDS